MPFDFAANGALDLSLASLSNWGVAISLDGGLCFPVAPPVAEDPARLVFDFAPHYDVSWSLEIVSDRDSVTVRSRIRNQGTEPVVLGEVLPVYQAHVVWGEPDDETCLLPYQSWRELRAYALHDPELPARAKIKTQGWNRTRGIALQAAFLTFEDVDTNVMLRPAGEGTACTLSACCDFDGWCLQPGHSVETEVFRLQLGTDPYAQLEGWARQAAERIQPRIWPDNPHGWLGWSWVDAVNGNETYESIARGNLEAINRRLGGLGIRHLWTSMSNFQGSQPGNWLEWNYRCIPSGREAFLDAVRAQGFVPGFWMGPFYISSALPDLVAELTAADALLRDEEGALLVVCAEWRHGDAGLIPKAERAELYSLDPTHPRTLEFLEKIFATYHDWGVRYYMVDFLEAAAGKLGRFPYDHVYDDSMIPGPQAYRHSLEAIKRAAGEDTFLLSSSGPKLHNAGPMDGVRVGNDLGEGRAITPDSFFYPASYVINNMSFWTAAAYALNCMGAYYHTHRTLFVNNAGNVLTVGQPVPLNEARVMATLHALSGGPTMLGDDIRRISEDRLQLIARTFPRSNQAARPLDLFESVSPAGPRRFLRRVETSWGSYSVLALFNLGDAPQVLTVELASLGYGAGTACLVWEFWNEKYLGTYRGQVVVHVPQETVLVLRITENRNQPTLLGTDMHVLMGEAEISDFRYDPDSMTCTLTATRPRGNTGMAVIHAPAHVRVDNCDGVHLAKDGRDDTLIIGIPLDFTDSDRITRTLQFSALEAPLDMRAMDLA
jgi:hypothetical protein